MHKDLFGKALMDYFTNNYSEDLITWTDISDEDTLPIPYLFRSFADMPKIEQMALKMASGKVLDVGCGSGSHSLWLQNKGYQVKGIDISSGAVQVSKNRGVKNVELCPLLEECGAYDTVLILMNGTGIFEDLSKLTRYLLHLKRLLKPKGQVLLDSSDIIYMFCEDDGSSWMNLSKDYYGELSYNLSYKGEIENPFKWLYLDFERLRSACLSIGLNCERVIQGDHFDYLARITAEY